jgi:hypothetical protein
MVRVCIASVRRQWQTEGDRSSPPPTDGGRHEWGWPQFAAPISLHLSGEHKRPLTPLLPLAHGQAETTAAGASPSRWGKAEGRRSSNPHQPCRSRPFPSSKQQSSPPTTALLPSGAPAGAALCWRIQRLPLLPLLTTNSLNCNLIMSHECFDRRRRQLLRYFQEQMVV